jgi:hypothetical protein
MRLNMNKNANARCPWPQEKHEHSTNRSYILNLVSVYSTYHFLDVDREPCAPNYQHLVHQIQVHHLQDVLLPISRILNLNKSKSSSPWQGKVTWMLLWLYRATQHVGLCIVVGGASRQVPTYGVVALFADWSVVDLPSLKIYSTLKPIRYWRYRPPVTMVVNWFPTW